MTRGAAISRTGEDTIWAFRYHGVLPENLEAATFGHSLKTYGWVYLVVAIVLILSAFSSSMRSLLTVRDEVRA